MNKFNHRNQNKAILDIVMDETIKPKKRGKNMINYTVNYSIDVEADNHIQAAKIVEDFMKKAIYRPAFTVISPDGKEFFVDLEDEEVKE